MDLPSSLSRAISPPCSPRRSKAAKSLCTYPVTKQQHDTNDESRVAAVEASRAKVEDHLKFFKHHLTRALRGTPTDVPRISVDEFSALYQSNQHHHGHHFVIHQHNHPKAGVHYDLRLQFSATSSVSWALPKGLPGNPNSRRPGRMAIETRVHNLWNNLIESASMKTGSLLIWDTGTYSVLQRKKSEHEIPSLETTDDESETDGKGIRELSPENVKLVEAFRTRHVRLRLHGTRLPNNYTITLRRPPNHDILSSSITRRRRRRPVATHRRPSNTSDSDDTSIPSINSRQRPTKIEDDDMANKSRLDTDSDEDMLTRAHNAYPGSTNSIGSVHQRRWFVLLDRPSSGFESNGGKWTRRPMSNGDLGGFEPFVVRGRDYERSVVTGRLARDVESDGGCKGYIGRGGWQSIED